MQGSFNGDRHRPLNPCTALDVHASFDHRARGYCGDSGRHGFTVYRERASCIRDTFRVLVIPQRYTRIEPPGARERGVRMDNVYRRFHARINGCDGKYEAREGKMM